MGIDKREFVWVFNNPCVVVKVAWELIRLGKWEFVWEFSQLSCSGQTRTRVAWELRGYYHPNVDYLDKSVYFLFLAGRCWARVFLQFAYRSQFNRYGMYVHTVLKTFIFTYFRASSIFYSKLQQRAGTCSTIKCCKGLGKSNHFSYWLVFSIDYCRILSTLVHHVWDIFSK